MKELPQNNLPDWLTETVKQFIESAEVSGDMALPFFYPLIQQLESFQIGFRQHGLSGESLISSSEGDWQPSWYAIARNQFDDPFFIDIDKGSQGFPVYYAAHGPGRWDALQVAPSIGHFRQLLAALILLADDDTAAAQYIKAETDASNKLWIEVLEGRLSRQQELAEKAQLTQLETPINAPINADDWLQGALILTDAGPQKLKVVQCIQQILDLSPHQALALISKGDIPLGEGYFIHLRRHQHKLVALGATLVFRQHS